MRENYLNEYIIKSICLRFQTVVGDMFGVIITCSPFYLLLLLICLFHTFTLLDRKTFSVFTFGLSSLG